MAVTLREVAKKAKVAPSTVSRVISNDPRISEPTKERVLRVMEELQYHPNLTARSLVNRSTETFGIIMPRSAETGFSNPFFPEVIRGISVTAHARGRSLLLSTGEREEEAIGVAREMIYGRRVDGVILLVSRVDDPLIHLLQEEHFPLLLALNFDDTLHCGNVA